MKQTYEKILALILLTIIALALILPKNYFINPIKSSFLFIFAPVQKTVTISAHSVFNFFSTIGQISKLAKENNELRDEKEKLIAEQARLVEVERENEILREQLDFQKKNTFSLISANVIAKDPTNLQKSFIIDAGQKDGVQAGMPVISSGNLVGKISEVFYNSSQVLLITNPNSIVNAMLQESRALGLARGDLKYGILMESIPQEIKINISDLVITSGLGGNFPKGLLIGEVSEIISRQGEIFQSAILRPFVDFSKLELVFVICGVK